MEIIRLEAMHASWHRPNGLKVSQIRGAKSVIPMQRALVLVVKLDGTQIRLFRILVHACRHGAMATKWAQNNAMSMLLPHIHIAIRRLCLAAI